MKNLLKLSCLSVTLLIASACSGYTSISEKEELEPSNKISTAPVKSSGLIRNEFWLMIYEYLSSYSS